MKGHTVPSLSGFADLGDRVDPLSSLTPKTVLSLMGSPFITDPRLCSSLTHSPHTVGGPFLPFNLLSECRSSPSTRHLPDLVDRGRAVGPMGDEEGGGEAAGGALKGMVEVLVWTTPLVFTSLVCVVLAVGLSLGEGMLPSYIAGLHQYLGAAAVAAYVGHLVHTHVLSLFSSSSPPKQHQGVSVGEEAAGAEEEATTKREGNGVVGKEDGEEKRRDTVDGDVRAKSGSKRPSSSSSSRSGAKAGPSAAAAGGGAVVAATTSSTVAGASQQQQQPAAAGSSSTSWSQSVSADGSRLVSKFGGRYPMVINYGHMSHLTLSSGPDSGSAASSSAAARAGMVGTSGALPPTSVPGTAGALSWGGSRGMGGEEGAMGGGLFGGAAAAGATRKSGGGKTAGGGKEKSGSGRKLSDFDRVLAHHASNCKSRRKEGQDLVAAIKKEQQDAGTTTTATRTTTTTAASTDVDDDQDEEENRGLIGWIDHLDQKEGGKDLIVATTSTPTRRLESDFFRRQRGGSTSSSTTSAAVTTTTLAAALQQGGGAAAAAAAGASSSSTAVEETPVVGEKREEGWGAKEGGAVVVQEEAWASSSSPGAGAAATSTASERRVEEEAASTEGRGKEKKEEGEGKSRNKAEAIEEACAVNKAVAVKGNLMVASAPPLLAAAKANSGKGERVKVRAAKAGPPPPVSKREAGLRRRSRKVEEAEEDDDDEEEDDDDEEEESDDDDDGDEESEDEEEEEEEWGWDEEGGDPSVAKRVGSKASHNKAGSKKNSSSQVDEAATMKKKKKKKVAAKSKGAGGAVAEGKEEIPAYSGDLEYLQDQFRALSLLLRKNEILVHIRERLLLGKPESEASIGLDGSAAGGGIVASGAMPAYMAAALSSTTPMPRTKRMSAKAMMMAPTTGGAAFGGGLDDPDNAASRRKVEEAEEELAEMREWTRARLVQTFSEKDGWIPRLEILAKTLHLRVFERHVLVLLIREYLVSRYLGSAASGLGAEQSDRMGSFYRSMPPRGSSTRRFDIKTLCAYFSVTFTEQLQAANKYFSVDSPLVANGIITFTPGRSTYEDLYLMNGSHVNNSLDAVVSPDEKLCDFLLGLDETPASQVPVKGGLSVYTPSVSLDDVILSQQTRGMVEEAVQGLKGYWELLHEEGGEGGSSSEALRRGATVFLLAGRQGVGKSTLADAIATSLGKRVLMVDDGADLAHTSLQAKIHDAIVVVEDMKSLKDDDGGAASCLFSLVSAGRNQKSKVKDAIKELDTSQNLFIFQTESLESVPSTIARRLALVVELESPDMSMRRKIWDALKPPHVELTDDVDLDELAMKWVLPGGRIKEAWTTAQVSAILRSGHGRKVMQSDLMKAAQRQLHGKLQLANLAEKTTPLRGLDQAVLPPSVKKDLQTMIDYAKVSGVLFGQWGFDLHHGTTKGMSALFYGPPGTGKTLAAEILAYELGKPIKKVNLSEVISMWVGESEKLLEAMFKDAKEADVVLFLDEAESLLRKRTQSSANYETRWSNLLLQRIETYEGVLVAATNLSEIVDEAYQRRFKFWVQFPKPGSDDRGGIWRTLLPPQAPLASDVDFKYLGQRFELTGGEIKSAVFRAAMRAASRDIQGDQQPQKGQEITMKDLTEAAEEEEKKKNEGIKYPYMYT